MMTSKRLLSTLMVATFLLTGTSLLPTADAKHYRNHGRYNDARRPGGVDYKTGKIIKGGLIGAGVGAGAGLLLDRPVGRTAVVGAGVGAGTQAVRHSSTLRRHPIVKTGAYGALAGTGVSAVTGKKLAPGALWGGAIGTGVGALNHF
ncbi:hypothetical protein [Vampirovibrio sp.]|uniref:hypothetical protein n=1 Tax=Vampirovibrio sp. TaxID=2717857 RepID=UPI0035944611